MDATHRSPIGPAARRDGRATDAERARRASGPSSDGVERVAAGSGADERVDPKGSTPQAVAEQRARQWARQVEEAVAGLVALVEEHPDHAHLLDTATRRRTLASLNTVDRVVVPARGVLLRVEEDSRDWARGGFRSAEDWHASTTRSGVGQARSEMRLAEDLAAMPDLARGLQDGSVPLTHARTVSKALRRGNAPARRAAMKAGLEAELVQAARSQDAPSFAKKVDRRMADVDREGLRKEFDKAHEARYLRTQPRPGGALWGEFLLDPAGAQAFTIGIDAATPAPGRDDRRSRDQRRADGLVAMVKAGLASRGMKPGALLPPQVDLVVQDRALADRLLRERSARAAGGGNGQADGGHAPVPTGPRATGMQPGPQDDGRADAQDDGRSGVRPDVVSSPGATRPGPRPESSEGADAEAAVAVVTKAGPGGSTGTEPGSAAVAEAEDSLDEGAVALRAASADAEPPGSGAPLPGAVDHAGDGVVHARGSMPGGPTGNSPPGCIPTVTWSDGRPAPDSEVEAVLCDCDIARMVLGADGAPLDVGTAQRLFTGPVRKAIWLRDGGTCAWPGCEMPAEWGEVHHIVPWQDGGPTGVDNGICLCTFHHHTGVHARGAVILPIPGGFRFLRADGRLIGDSFHARRTRPTDAPTERVGNGGPRVSANGGARVSRPDDEAMPRPVVAPAGDGPARHPAQEPPTGTQPGLFDDP